MNNYLDFNEMPEMIREFLVYLGTIKNKSKNTVKEYYLDLRTFFRFIKIKKGLIPSDVDFSDIDISDVDINLIKSVTISDIYEFMNFSLTERNNSAKTRARKTSSLKTFYKYHTHKSLKLSIDPTQDLEAPKVKKSLPKYLTLEESIELLNAVDGKYKERDYCIITLFLNCGLRLSELTALNINSFKGENQLLVTGKGNKERLVYLNEACVSALKEYKKVRPVNGIKDRNALFLSRQNNRISPKTVQAMVNKYLQKIGLDGVVLTKLDGDTRGGAALSIRAVTGKPIIYSGMGEKLSDLEQFYPDRMASRILGMGDILTMIEKVQDSIDEEEAKKLEEKVRKQQFDYEMFLDSMSQMKKMGGITSMLGMMPGMGAKMPEIDTDAAEKQMARTEAIIYSMTPQERQNPKLMNPSRKRRIAAGAGVDIAEVNRLVKQFEQMQKMMKKMPGMMKGKRRRNPFGGGRFPF